MKALILSIIHWTIFMGLFIQPTSGQECLNYENHSFGEPLIIAEGSSLSILVHGDYLYAGTVNPARLLILEDFYLANPVQVGYLDLEDTPHFMEIIGGYLFLFHDNVPEMAIYTLDDPLHPELLSTIPGALNPNRLALVGNHLIASYDREVRIYDISNPNEPTLANTLIKDVWCYGAEIIDGYLYLGQVGQIQIYDISDPAFPYLITEFGDEKFKSIARSGDHLYVASTSRIRVFDISDPLDPILLASESGGWYPGILALYGNKLLQKTGGYLSVFDISDPTALRHDWYRPDLGTVTDICVSNSHLLIFHTLEDGSARIERIHEVDLLFPYQGMSDLPTQPGKMVVRDNLGYAASGQYLVILDFSSPEGPTILSRLTISDIPEYQWVGLTWPYVVLKGHSSHPLKVVDVTDPTQPILTHALENNFLADDLAMKDNFLYLAEGTGRIRTFKVVDGFLQEFSGGHNTVSSWGQIEVAGDHLLGRTYNTHFVFRISSDGHLDLLSTSSLDAPRTMRVSGRFLFDVGHPTTYSDIEDPTQPIPLGTFPVDAGQVLVNDSMVYISSSGGWLHALDITDLLEPVLVGTLPMHGPATSMGLVGDSLALVTSGRKAYTAWQQCPGTIPTLLQVFELTRTEEKVAIDFQVSDGLIVPPVLWRIADSVQTEIPTSHLGGGCFEAMDFFEPGTFESCVYRLTLNGLPLAEKQFTEVPALGCEVRLSTHPNPFNPSITLSFSLGRHQEIELGIFDLHGKRIAIIASGEYPAGSFTLDWHGQDEKGRSVSSGTYLVQMVAEEGVAMQKVTLVR